MSLGYHSAYSAVNWFEIAVVMATGVLHLVLQSRGAIGVSIAVASVFWVTYIAWQIYNNPKVWSAWGFRTDNLAAAFKYPTLLFVLAGIAMAIYGALAGNLLWHWYMLLLCLLYPLWGIVQQFLWIVVG